MAISTLSLDWKVKLRYFHGHALYQPFLAFAPNWKDNFVIEHKDAEMGHFTIWTWLKIDNFLVAIVSKHCVFLTRKIAFRK